MVGYIYMLVAPTGEAYIGRTKNFKRRMNGYSTQYNSDRSPIYRAVAKYGFENFQKYVLEEIEADTYEELTGKLNLAEESYIAKYDTVNHGLNRNKFDSNRHIVHISDEHKEKVRKAHLGTKHSSEWRNKIAGENAYQSKKVTSDKLGIVFCSLRDAAHYVGVSNGCKISECITGKRKSCGEHPETGERIDDWRFV